MNSNCRKCDQLCCRYITTALKTPRTIVDFENLIWMVLHKNIHVFKDNTGWYLLVKNACKEIKSGKCGNYAQRPVPCRIHSEDGCEYHGSVEDSAEFYFKTRTELESYCAKKFKNWRHRHSVEFAYRR